MIIKIIKIIKIMIIKINMKMNVIKINNNVMIV